MEYINAAELKQRLDAGEEIFLIDIREPYELDICRVSVANHIPMAEVSSRLHELPETGLVVLMCKSGARASAVTNLLLQDFGRSNVMILDGGIMAWIEEVEPHLERY